MKTNLNPRAGRAFTLVEIMIAIAIFSLLVAAIYSTWTLILRATQVGNAAAAQVQRQRIALRTLEDSLTCIQSYQASLKYYSFVVQNGDQPMLSFVARVPAVFPRNGRFGDFNLRRLTFTLESGSNGEKDLVLRQNPILMDVDSDEQSTPLVLAHNVQDFVIECLDTNQTGWIGEWDDTNSIPPILRVSLLFGTSADASGKSGALSFTRVIATPCMMMPGFLQTPGAGAGGANPGGINFNAGGNPGGANNGTGRGTQNPPGASNPSSHSGRPNNFNNPFNRGPGGQPR